MNMILITAAAFATLMGSAASTAAAPAATIAVSPAALTISFTGLESKTGAIMVALFDSETAFDANGKPVREAMVPAEGATVEALFADLPAGRYGVKAFHDVDGDGKMATNPFGMPTEPFAFSNDAKGNMGPAKWADAAFIVSAGSTRRVITIR